ncbi:hypothetical protein [Alloscardovia omnicolens]
MSKNDLELLQDMNNELFRVSPLTRPLMLQLVNNRIKVRVLDERIHDQELAVATDFDYANDVIRAYYAGAAQHARLHRC